MTDTKKILLRLPAPIIVLGIWILSSQSTLPQIKGILGFDKLQHLGAFAVLALAICLWFWPQAGRRFSAPGCFLAAALLAAAYGGIDEAHQSFVPGRDCNVWDWLADSLGALLGAGLGAAAMRKLKIQKCEN